MDMATTIAFAVKNVKLLEAQGDGGVGSKAITYSNSFSAPPFSFIIFK